MRKLIPLLALVPMLLLTSCAGTTWKCPFARLTKPAKCHDMSKCEEKPHCPASKAAPTMSCCNKSGSISPTEREYYQALSKRAAIQEELYSKLAEERKNGATPSLTREIDAKRSELRAMQVRIEALDVKLQREKNLHS